MTLPELLTLATTTLAHVPHHPAVTAELCAAICWVESSGDPNARGDWDKSKKEFQSIGLAQFNIRTFTKFRSFCGSQVDIRHADYPCRDCPKCSMRALVRELSFAARKYHGKRPSLPVNRNSLANFHWEGSISPRYSSYCRKIGRSLKLVAKAASLKSEISNLKSGSRPEARGSSHPVRSSTSHPAGARPSRPAPRASKSTNRNPPRKGAAE